MSGSGLMTERLKGWLWNALSMPLTELARRHEMALIKKKKKSSIQDAHAQAEQSVFITNEM